MKVLCNERGVLTGFDSLNPIIPNGQGSGYQSASFATIVEKLDGSGANAIVYISNIDSNGGIQKNGISLIDGGSGWPLACNSASVQAYVN
jgi:hypothetical protein